MRQSEPRSGGSGRRARRERAGRAGAGAGARAVAAGSHTSAGRDTRADAGGVGARRDAAPPSSPGHVDRARRHGGTRHRPSGAARSGWWDAPGEGPTGLEQSAVSESMPTLTRA